MGMWDTARIGRRSILDAIRDFRNAEAQGAKAVVERLEDRRMLSMTWASIATSDGTGQQVQGGSVTFNLACGTDDGGDSNVTVNFGDSTSVSVTLSPDSNGNYSGTVSHSYTGTPTTVYTAVMDASETSLVSGGGDSTSGGSTYSSSYVTTYADANCDVTIVDAPITATPTTTTVVAGRPFTGVVATVADSYTGAQANEFSGEIIWGDGVTSAADFLAVPGSPGQFQVLGSHVYVSPTPSTAVTVNIQHGTAAATALSAAIATAITNTPSIAVVNVNTGTSGSPDLNYNASTNTLTCFSDYPISLEASNLGTDDHQIIENTYQWDFGDFQGLSTPTTPYNDHLGSRYNHLPGFNAAHIYSTPGDYQVKLIVTSVSGNQSVATLNVHVTANPNTEAAHIYYVDSVNGSDTNNGTSPTQAFQSLDHVIALHLVDGTYHTSGSANDNIRICLARGGAYPISSIFIVGNGNIAITDYAADPANPGDLPVVEPASSSNPGKFIRMGSWNGSPQPYGLLVQGVRFAGQNLTDLGVELNQGFDVAIRDCIFEDMIDGVKSDVNFSDGVLVQDNFFSPVQNFAVSPQGAAWSVLGNTIVGSIGQAAYRDDSGSEHWDHHLLVYGNDISAANNNSTAQFRGWAQDIYVAKNTFRSNWVDVGSNSPEEPAEREVFDSNMFLGARLNLLNPLTAIMVRNNVFELRPDQYYSALKVVSPIGIDSRLNLDSDIDIVNNTVEDTNTDVGHHHFLDSYTYNLSGLTIDNNLYITTQLVDSPLEFRIDDDKIPFVNGEAPLSFLAQAYQNRWPNFYTQNVNFVTFLFSPENSDTVVGTTVKDFPNFWSPQPGTTGASQSPSAGTDGVTPNNPNLVDEELWPDNSDADVPQPVGAANYDYNGDRRYFGGPTAGAVDRHDPPPLLKSIDIGFDPPTTEVASDMQVGSTDVVTSGRDYDIIGGGTRIGVQGANDQFRYVYQTRHFLQMDGTISSTFDVAVRVGWATNKTILPGAAPTAENLKSMAGLMVRESTGPTSPFFFVAARPVDDSGQTNGPVVVYRLSDGTVAEIDWTGSMPTTPDIWVRMTRSGDTYTGYWSSAANPQASDWLEIGSTIVTGLIDVAPPDTTYNNTVAADTCFGLAVAGNDPSTELLQTTNTHDPPIDGTTTWTTYASAIFRYLHDLPASAFTGTMIGSGSGSVTMRPVTGDHDFEIVGSGAGSPQGATSDSFYLASKAYSGDFDVMTMGYSMEAGGALPQFGLMIRSSLAADSPFAFVYARQGGQVGANNYGYQLRLTPATGTIDSPQSIPATIPEVWFRIRRSGATVGLYWSTDTRLPWNELDEFTMSGTVYAGMAVASGDSTLTDTFFRYEEPTLTYPS